MTPDRTNVRRRLDTALTGVAVSFQGMTAHPEEYNCECHWGSAEELALLKTPDVPLDGELLRRTYWTTDWDYPQELLRRILPQLTRGIVAGDVDPMMATTGPGVPFIRGDWQQWPAAQRDAVREFLDAWWRHVLVEPDAKVPAHEALEFLAEATATLTPWLATWADLLTDPVAQRRLVTAADEWIWDLVCDTHPGRAGTTRTPGVRPCRSGCCGTSRWRCGSTTRRPGCTTTYADSPCRSTIAGTGSRPIRAGIPWSG
ncbi:hypothetical protein GCM10027614_02920 [Micromonospora vulcania]